MLVYGVGAHLADMLEWHPELARRIERVFDKDSKKIGRICPGLKVKIESADSVKDLPMGTEIAVAAIRFMKEISYELKSMNPGLICSNIDDVYVRQASVGRKKTNEISISDLLSYTEPDFVEYCYEKILKRGSDAVSKKRYMNRLLNGTITRRQIIREMALSPEAQSQGIKLNEGENGYEEERMSMADLLNLSNREFLQAAYCNILKRELDIGGYDHYISLLLQKRMGKIDLLKNMLASPEGKAKGGRYKAELRRIENPTSAVQADEFDAVVNAMKEKMGDLTLVNKILISRLIPKEADDSQLRLPPNASITFRKLMGA